MLSIMYCMLPMINIYNVDKKLRNILFFESVNIFKLRRFKKTTKSLFFGRDGIPPNVDRFLNDHGNEFILEMII